MPDSAPACGYCHRPKTDHAPSCKRALTAACSCGGRARHKPGCERYRGKQAVARRKRKAITRNDPKAKPKGLRAPDLAQAVNGHRSAEALAIAREKAQESLEDARARAGEAQADVRALERLVAGLAG